MTADKFNFDREFARILDGLIREKLLVKDSAQRAVAKDAASTPLRCSFQTLRNWVKRPPGQLGQFSALVRAFPSQFRAILDFLANSSAAAAPDLDRDADGEAAERARIRDEMHFCRTLNRRTLMVSSALQSIAAAAEAAVDRFLRAEGSLQRRGSCPTGWQRGNELLPGVFSLEEIKAIEKAASRVRIKLRSVESFAGRPGLIAASEFIDVMRHCIAERECRYQIMISDRSYVAKGRPAGRRGGKEQLVISKDVLDVYRTFCGALAKSGIPARTIEKCVELKFTYHPIVIEYTLKDLDFALLGSAEAGRLREHQGRPIAWAIAPNSEWAGLYLLMDRPSMENSLSAFDLQWESKGNAKISAFPGRA